MNRISFVVFIMLVYSQIVPAEDFNTPMSRVKNSIERVITILKNEELDRTVSWQEISKVIDDSFDFRSMSQSVLATNWQRATPEERERFIDFFTRYLEETYRSKIESYSNQEVKYLKETINGKRAVVETVIVTEQTEIPVNYKLKDNDGQWYAYDVDIEGVSLVNNYRTTFSTVVKNEGMDGLISDIQRRIDAYKSSREAAEPPPSEI